MVEYKCGYNYAKVRRLLSQEKGWYVDYGNPVNEVRKYFMTKRSAIAFAKRWIASCKKARKLVMRM